MSRKTWDYQAQTAKSPADLIEPLVRLGKEGWELVSVVQDAKDGLYYAYLKRRLDKHS